MVTGGLNGIGAAIVSKLASQSDSEIYILDKFPFETFENESSFLRFSNVFYRQCDIGIPSSVKHVFDALSSENITLDSLVNNAAIKSKNNFCDEDIFEWKELLDVNLNGTYDVLRSFILQVDRDSTSRVVNIGSVNSKLISNSSASYHISKTAIIALTKYFSVHAPRMGIPLSINCVEPGFIVKNKDLDFYLKPSNKSYQEFVEVYHPNSLYGSEEDVARVCDWLLNDAPDYLSGQVIALDGGATNQEQSWLLRLASTP